MDTEIETQVGPGSGACSKGEGECCIYGYHADSYGYHAAKAHGHGGGDTHQAASTYCVTAQQGENLEA